MLCSDASTSAGGCTDSLFLIGTGCFSRRPLSEQGLIVLNKSVGLGTSVLRSIVTRSPPAYEVVAEEGQPFWLFAAEERLQCATTVCTYSRLDRQRSETS